MGRAKRTLLASAPEPEWDDDEDDEELDDNELLVVVDESVDEARDPRPSPLPTSPEARRTRRILLRLSALGRGEWSVEEEGTLIGFEPFCSFQKAKHSGEAGSSLTNLTSALRGVSNMTAVVDMMGVERGFLVVTVGVFEGRDVWPVDAVVVVLVLLSHLLLNWTLFDLVSLLVMVVAGVGVPNDDLRASSAAMELYRRRSPVCFPSSAAGVP